MASFALLARPDEGVWAYVDRRLLSYIDIAMTELQISDVRDWILAFDPERDRGQSLKGFLQFDRYPRNFRNSAVLRDCWFNDLFIPYFVKNWPGGQGPPNPGLFAEFFSLIVGRLVGSDRLTLHVKSVDPESFDELKCIENTLAPKRVPYMLLPSFRSGQYGPDVGNLFFEWSVDWLDLVRSEWFVSPQISIEGYITHGPCLTRLCEMYFAPDSEGVVRWFLGQIEIGFKLWRDNNGLLLLSDKFDADQTRNRIQVQDVNALIAEAVRDYEKY